MNGFEFVSVTIRPANLPRDKELIVRTLHRYLSSDWPETRFEWLYQGNPHGPTRAWLAVDDTNNDIVGTSAAFPRRISVNGIEKTGWVLGDFCIADKYRSLGPALQLQRATLAAVSDLREAELCYDFPSTQFKAVYQRLRLAPTAQMIRLAKPLRVDRKLEQLIASKILAVSAKWMGNRILQLLDMLRFRDRGWEVALHPGECGDEFTQLNERAALTNGIEVKRSATYLNWRYLKHPNVSFRILTARKKGELQGYVVFSSTGQDAHIAEWNTCDDKTVLKALMWDLFVRLRKSGTITVSAFLLENDHRLLLLKSMGFRPRDSDPLIVYWPGSKTADENKWLLMHGDRDT